MKSWLTPLQARIYDKHVNDVRDRNERGVKRWRRETRARAEPRYTVVVAR